MTRANHKSIEIPAEVHSRLMDYQETVRRETGERPTLRGCIGMLLDKEALFRSRLKRLNDMALKTGLKDGAFEHDNPYAIAADLMAGEVK